MQNLRWKIKRVLAEGESAVGKSVVVKGWVRTKRGSKNVNFIALNDGSTVRNLQVVADPEQIGEDILRRINTGA
ncbi:MAG: OB-fold nucleic acid binding domain-containing protein, partial [Bacteroidota bacterium]